VEWPGGSCPKVAVCPGPGRWRSCRVLLLNYAEQVAQVRTCGTWRLPDGIGGGGNGDVYRCVGTVAPRSGLEAAIKILKTGRNERRDRVPRFRNEIDFLLRAGGRRAVLPMLDHALPDDPSQRSWYVMPLAVPLVQALGPSPELPGVVAPVVLQSQITNSQ